LRNLWLRRAPSLGSLEVWSTGSSQNSGRQRPGSRVEAVSWYWRFLLMIILARQVNSRESGCLRFKGSDATLVHLRDLWHDRACAIASAGVFCKTFLSKAFR